MPEHSENLNTPIPEVNDLVSRPPSWLLKSGISILALGTIIILLLASYIKYPDKIHGTGLLTSKSPPIQLVSKSAGYIENVLVDDGKIVHESDRLFYIKNTANPEQIEELLSWIDQFEKIPDPRDYVKLHMPDSLQVGLIQNDYAALQLKFNELQQTLKYGMPFQQMKNINEEIAKINLLNESQGKEKEIYKQELYLEEKDFDRSKSLHNGGVISKQELEQAQTRLLQKQRQYESMENTIIQNKIRMQQLELEKLKIQGDRSNLVKSYQFYINEISARIRSNVENWNHTYYISAPIEGKISLINHFHKNSTIQQGDVLGYILPDKGGDSYFLCRVYNLNIGKIEVGQTVLIKLDAYPYKEFGQLVSQVSKISPLPQMDEEGKHYYEVLTSIVDSIVTDTGQRIPNKPNMRAQIEIITEDKTILERIFQRIISLINQQEVK